MEVNDVNLGGDPENAAHITGRYQEVESAKVRIQKFKMFFAGLVFATLSFIGIHPINTQLLFLKISETISLTFLLLCGIILLVQLAEYGVRMSDDVCFVKRKFFEYVYVRNGGYWFLFIIGMGLMVFDRSALSFVG